MEGSLMHLPDGTRCVEVLVDIATCGLTLNQVMDIMIAKQAADPTADVWLDGDRYAILSLEGVRE